MHKIIYVVLALVSLSCTQIDFLPARSTNIKTMALVAMTWKWEEPLNPEWWNIAPMTKGYQYEYYKKKVLGTGASDADIIETATTIQFVKSAILPFLSSFDYAFNWHGWPPGFIDVVHKVSNGRTKLGPIHAVEAIISAGAWNPEMEALRQIVYPSHLVSTKRNRWGCLSVDVYESARTPAKCAENTDRGTPGSAWSIDMRLAHSFAEKLVAHLPEADIQFFDSVLDRPYFGSATNGLQYPEEEYRAGWTAILSKVKGAWGNAWVGAMYPKEVLPVRWQEHFFRGQNFEARPLAELQADILLAKNMGYKLGFGVYPGRDSVNAWALGPAQWKELIAFIQETKSTNTVFVNNARNYLFFQDGFKE